MDEAQISDPLVWKVDDASRILIGKVISPKTFSRTAMETILQKAWNLQTGFDVIEIDGNAFLFKFEEEKEYSRILRGRPWSINGNLLNLMERMKYKSYAEFDFSRCPVWIQMHNVPLEAMCSMNAIRIGGHVGEVLLVEDPIQNGRYLRSFLRARILLDLRKPLANGFWLPKPDGGRIWISVRYEKLQCFCYNCGKIGHANKDCKSERMLYVDNKNESRYGPWITTNSCRNWDEILVVVRHDWEEASYVRRKQEEAMLRKREVAKQTASKVSMADEEELFFIKPGERRIDHGRENMEGRNDTDDSRYTKDDVLQEVTNRVREGTSAKVLRPESCMELDLLNQYKNMKSEDTASDPGPSVGALPKNASVQAATPLILQDDNSLAMVPFNGEILNDVINVMTSLGIKRNAEGELMPEVLKRRKICVWEAEPLIPAISSYANDLRKIKKKLGSNDPVGSDHHALVIDCCFNEVRAPKTFKFEAYWVEHDDFLHIVENSWNEVVGVAKIRRWTDSKAGCMRSG
ncbi:hypothetical protein K1719_005225 [Acacia pycnantha]|nr:hypothetical protein K1719_005225 [Acacia pycnantha]